MSMGRDRLFISWGRDQESYPTLYVEGPKGGHPILDNIHGSLTVFLFLIMEFISQSICLNGAFLYTMNHNEKEINKVPVCEWILFYKEMNCPYLGCFSSILTKQAIYFSQPSWTTESLSWYIWPLEKSSSSFPEASDDWAQSTRGWEKSKPGVYRAVPGTKKRWWYSRFLETVSPWQQSNKMGRSLRDKDAKVKNQIS